MSNSLAQIQRTFIIGDEWLYYKIYTGYKTSDTIIRLAIKPLVEELIAQKLIDKWFFIRYNDPEYHLRVRFHITDKSKYAEIILKFNDAFKFYVQEDLIWKVQVDTYKREIERYGVDTMVLSEDLFFYDSNAIVSLIGVLHGQSDENLRWKVTIKMIDSLLDDFKFTLGQKKELLGMLQENFMKEFGFDKDSRKHLGAKFRKHKNEVENTLNNELHQEFSKILEKKTEDIELIVAQLLSLQKENKLEVELSNLLSSYIHMLVNRMMRTNQRKYELVLYDFMQMFYTSKLARKNKQIEVAQI